MRRNKFWLGLLGVASLLGVFAGQFPYSLVPLAFFLFLSLPDPESPFKAAQRRSRSRAVRRPPRAAVRVPQVRVLDPVEVVAAAEALTSIGEPVPDDERVLEDQVA